MTGMLFLKSPRRIKTLMFTQMEENIKTGMMTVQNKGAIFVVSKKNIYSLCCVCYCVLNSKKRYYYSDLMIAIVFLFWITSSKQKYPK